MLGYELREFLQPPNPLGQYGVLLSLPCLSNGGPGSSGRYGSE